MKFVRLNPAVLLLLGIVVSSPTATRGASHTNYDETAMATMETQLRGTSPTSAVAENDTTNDLSLLEKAIEEAHRFPAANLYCEDDPYMPISGTNHSLADDQDDTNFPASDTDSNSEGRWLQSAFDLYFRPLSCNARPCNLGTTTWTKERYNVRKTVVIPCGKCVIMDYPHDLLVLPKGLDIQGHLTFPDGYRLRLEVPFLYVQGLLKMTATRAVTGVPNLHVVFRGDHFDHFRPHDQNDRACPKSGCDVGFKKFVVAGGRVQLDGLPPSCKTWVHLEDTVSGGTPMPVEFTRLPASVVDGGTSSFFGGPCRSTVYMHDDFSPSPLAFVTREWTGGYGGDYELTGEGTFVMANRRSEFLVPTWDMKRITSCLIPHQTYLFEARLKLTKKGVTDKELTKCGKINQHCVTLQSTVKTATSQITQRKGWENQKNQRRYNEWKNFYASFTYRPSELDDSNVYQLLQIRGPESGVSMEMDDVKFYLPDASLVHDADHVCDGNLILNGNAEASKIHPYPIEVQGGHLTVMQDTQTGGNFFRQSGRTTNGDSIIYYFDAPGCLVPAGRYEVSARIRIGSSNPAASRIEIRWFLPDNTSVQRTLLGCPKSSSSVGWVLCESVVTVPPELAIEDVSRIRLEFETVGAPTADMDLDDMKLRLLDGSTTSIVVREDGVTGCWNTGAEVVISSHTLDYRGQVRKLVRRPKSIGNGMVQLDLDSAIVPPTTKRQSSDFAVEVALLSRNILMEGADDLGIDYFGAHFMVTNTQRAVQIVNGIEFRNFGQEGILGRYPIHFHLCNDLDGSIVSKNSIRNSKQRCIVIHGSHNLTVADNVVHDSVGHCYMLEDGGEIDNVFRNNIGLETRAARFLVSADETDHVPSTFWCTNPANVWTGNVAAGSSHNGFWLELRNEVRGPSASMPLSPSMNPRFTNLGTFRDNVAHSNGNHGFRTYPKGYLPPDEAVFRNVKAFKNKQVGVFFHNSRNLAVEDSLLANNRIQLDCDFADRIRIEDTSLIGITPEYRNIMDSQAGIADHSETLIGIELHGFTRQPDSTGATIRNVRFRGFPDSGSDHVALIEIDNELGSGHFNYWTTLEKIRLSADLTSNSFSFFRASEVGYDDVYITDLDSSMKPAGSAASGVSTVIRNTKVMTTFIAPNLCERFSPRQTDLLYCRDTCLRTVSFNVDPAGTEHYVLRVSGQGKSVDIPGHYETEEDELRNTWIRKSRVFAATLPAGSYTAHFLHRGGRVWPSYVEQTYEPRQCPKSLNAGDISLRVPKNQDCADLIRNGNMEDSSTEATYWLHHESGLTILPGSGRVGSGGGSNALADTYFTSPAGAMGQFLDTRCLQGGSQYEIKVWVKLLANGKTVSCDSVSGCPRARVKVRTASDADGSTFDDFNLDVATYFVRPFRGNGWNLLQGVLSVDMRISSADSVAFYVERGLTDAQMLLDDVSIAPIAGDCNELVFNGDFNTGTSIFWQRSARSDALEMDIVTMRNRNYALRMSGRSISTDSPMQEIRIGCLTKGTMYMVSAKIRVDEESDGSSYDCDPTRYSNGAACPRIRLRAFRHVGLASQTVVSHDGGSIAVTDHGMTSDGWRTMSGLFAATQADEVAEKLQLTFEQVTPGKVFVIDDVSIRPLARNCGELIVNGDAELGETPRLWRTWLNNLQAKLALTTRQGGGGGGGGRAFVLSDRKRSDDGMYQYVDPDCIAFGRTFRVSMRMLLRAASSGVGTSCDPDSKSTSTGCPPVRVAGWQAGSKVYDERFWMTNRPAGGWSSTSMNDYETIFTVPSLLDQCDRVSIAIRSFNVDWDLYVDDIFVSPV